MPRSRRDIADYRGLTIETISRTLTGLESTCGIEVQTSDMLASEPDMAISARSHHGADDVFRKSRCLER
jgi:CRP/FNR family nitrogen fixation transcriptional regulator